MFGVVALCNAVESSSPQRHMYEFNVSSSPELLSLPVLVLLNRGDPYIDEIASAIQVERVYVDGEEIEISSSVALISDGHFRWRRSGAFRWKCYELSIGDMPNLFYPSEDVDVAMMREFCLPSEFQEIVVYYHSRNKRHVPISFYRAEYRMGVKTRNE